MFPAFAVRKKKWWKSPDRTDSKRSALASFRSKSLMGSVTMQPREFMMFFPQAWIQRNEKPKQGTLLMDDALMAIGPEAMTFSECEKAAKKSCKH